MAVIGSGPAGFYTAYRVMSKVPQARVDMYEALPVPFGLVRHGVAPDHPEVKNCQEKFEEVASSPNFTFLGNVVVDGPLEMSTGDSSSADQCAVGLASLTRHYDAVLFAYGASQDKKLGIPGESTLQGIYSARQFVGWYNGHPDCADLQVDANLSGAEEAVIIGQGNVALDVARILLEEVDVLRKTDITEQALAALSQSRIKRVHVVGRRGPMQASFTIKEVRELMKLPDVGFHPVDRSLIPEDIKSLPRASKRLMDVIVNGSRSLDPLAASKSWSLDSCLSPSHFLSHENHVHRVASTEFSITSLLDPFDPSSRIADTGEKTILPSDVVFRSVGYKSVPLAGFAEAGIHFDERSGTVTNDGVGRAVRQVSDGSGDHSRPQQVPGLYCAGWLKTGPTGVIASTMQDAFTTGDALVQDWTSGKEFLTTSRAGWEGVKQEIGASNASRAVTWDQWRKIDAVERERGLAIGKVREKFTRTKDMLDVIG